MIHSCLSPANTVLGRNESRAWPLGARKGKQAASRFNEVSFDWRWFGVMSTQRIFWTLIGGIIVGLYDWCKYRAAIQNRIDSGEDVRFNPYELYARLLGGISAGFALTPLLPEVGL
ncbi:MAG: hypothetical protein MH204_08295 [Fimbriimonadaceae bacterium]|nr:hypothetical protein [Fimbriimonadaceae bacterium]